MRAIWVCLIVVLAGCAGTTPPADTPQPVQSGPTADPEPAPREPWGRFAMSLSVTPQTEHAPTDATLRLDIRPMNAIGQQVAADVQWTLSGAGGLRQGQGLHHVEEVRLARGTHTFVATATAPDFRDGNADATVVVDPLPLVASIEAPQNVTRGQWFNVSAAAAHGYSDLGVECAWGNSTPAQFEDAMACATRARWLVEGSSDLSVAVDDGHEAVTMTAALEILPAQPLAPPATVPSEVVLTDAEGPTPEEPFPPQSDITAAWFDSGIDALYAGLSVRNATDPLPRTTTYEVAFTPSWMVVHEGSSVERLRLSTSWHAVDGTNVALPEGIWVTVLEGLQGEDWAKMADLPSVRPAAESGILWWTVGRDVMQAPLLGGSISQIVAGAGPGPADPLWDAAESDGVYALE